MEIDITIIPEQRMQELQELVNVEINYMVVQAKFDEHALKYSNILQRICIHAQTIEEVALLSLSLGNMLKRFK